MASLESRRIRATFVNDRDVPPSPIEEQRKQWEAAVAEVNAGLDAAITPVDIYGIPGEWVAAPDIEAQGALLFLHGGGYNAGSCVTHRAMAARLARATRARVLQIDYRLAPEHPCPAAIQDAARAYGWLIEQPIPAEQIAIGGDSAGGGLALATLIELRDSGAPLPAAGFLLSPWLDMALIGESMQTRAQIDPLSSYEGLLAAAQLYLGGRDPRDPQASPLYADPRDLPPLLIHVGDHEVLLSDATRLADRARAVGVQIQLEIWDEMWHVWHTWADDLPEAREAIARLGMFIRQQFDSRQYADGSKQYESY
ncbi:MAG TPA: alpha/beta hydrolase [Roseiflexaceae bacterium]|nr:alpha/beta hydrolase [Roseiflexaceae bacterium]